MKDNAHPLIKTNDLLDAGEYQAIYIYIGNQWKLLTKTLTSLS